VSGVQSTRFEHASSLARRERSWRHPAAGWLILGILAAVYGPTLVWLVERWTLSVWHNAHGLFIPPLVAWLAYRELRARPELRNEAGSASGFLLLVPAVVLQVLDAALQTQLLSAVSIVIAAPGLSLLLLGVQRTRVIAVPLALLAFALPIPLTMTEPVHLALRKIGAAGTAAVLPFLGVTVFHEGTTLYLRNATLQVVDACSGFSTVYASLAVACLVAYTARSARRRLLVLIVAAPIAVASNVIRLVFTALLVLWQGLDVLQTSLHELTGLLTFAIALPLIFWIGGPAGGRR
jgi:exosortase